MRRYRAAPYFFGTWAIIMGAWAFLLAVWSAVVDLGLPVTAAAASAGVVLVAGGWAAVRRSRTSEEVPRSVVEAIGRARAGEGRGARRPPSARSRERGGAKH